METLQHFNTEWFRKAILIVVIIFLFGQTNYANALTLSPLRYFISIAPGEGQTISVDLKNEESQIIKVRPAIMGVKQDQNGGTSFGKGIDVAEKWVAPMAEAITIAPGKTKNISFVVSVPQSAAPGAHYLGVGVETLSVQGGNLGMGGRLLSLITLQVAGVANEEIKILNWISGDNWIGVRNWDFNLLLKNTGNVESAASGDLQITSWAGKLVAKESYFGRTNILSQSVREFDKKIDLSKNIFWPGPYTARVQLNYGLTNQTGFANITIWYWPWWVWVVVIALVVLVVVGKNLINRQQTTVNRQQ